MPAECISALYLVQSFDCMSLIPYHNWSCTLPLGPVVSHYKLGLKLFTEVWMVLTSNLISQEPIKRFRKKWYTMTFTLAIYCWIFIKTADDALP